MTLQFGTSCGNEGSDDNIPIKVLREIRALI
jgi:hypothetical protein